jgi:hypothetical protein
MKRFLALLLLIPALACAGLLTQTANKSFVASSSDTTPNAFSFTDQTGVALSSTITSAAVTISGITASITCSATSGTIDVNSSGSFSSSQSVSNNNTIRARHTSSASNSTAVNTVVDCNGVSDTFTSTTESAGGSGVFFEPDFDSFGSNPNAMFDTWNSVGDIDYGFTTDVVRPGGSAKSLYISYGEDEAEWHGTVDFVERGLASGTTTIYARKWIYFPALWESHWPVGLKTSRFFTDSSDGQAAYFSEKYVWQNYPGDPGPGGGGGDPDLAYAWGLNHACYNDDRIQKYTDEMIFGNGLPYIRTGHWYALETFAQMNSADNVADGILESRVDGVVVSRLTDVAFQASARVDSEGNSPKNGTHWFSMWFGGNISTTSNDNFPTGQRLIRYEDGYYLSTTADWLTF